MLLKIAYSHFIIITLLQTTSVSMLFCSSPDEEVVHATTTIAQLRVMLEKEGRTIQHGGGGKFEWVDGLLVQALKEGDWLLIDNVNFCR